MIVRLVGTLEVFLALGIAALAGCVREAASDVPAPRRRPRAHEGVLATALVSERPGEAEAALAPALASELGAADLGRAASEREARAAARALGADLLLACRVAAYDPYDPQKLVLELVLVDIASARLGAEDVMAFGRTAALDPARQRAREATLWAARAEIDAGSDEILRAFAAEQGLGSLRRDLVEASILIRDPTRFIPFAAGLVASRAPVRATAPTPAVTLAAQP